MKIGVLNNERMTQNKRHASSLKQRHTPVQRNFDQLLKKGLNTKRKERFGQAVAMNNVRQLSDDRMQYSVRVVSGKNEKKQDDEDELQNHIGSRCVGQCLRAHSGLLD